jgi:predicted nucleic acid-binding protein
MVFLLIKYVLDTNIFINMQRRHPPDIFESLWKKIDELIDNDAIVSCQEVLEELGRGDDSLVTWAKQRSKIFLKSDVRVQGIVRNILAKYPDFLTGSRKSNNADPFVIALAKLEGYTLVSDETRAGGNQPPKIPNICYAYNIKLLKFVEFLREVKIKI